jgi:excisionase family DNA binding protein
MNTYSDTPHDSYLTVDDACRLLRCNRTTLYRLTRRGDAPPYVTFGARRLYRREDIDSWLDARTVNPSDARSATPNAAPAAKSSMSNARNFRAQAAAFWGTK